MGYKALEYVIFTSFIYNVDSYLPQIQKRISPFNCANKPDKIDYIFRKAASALTRLDVQKLQLWKL